MGFWHIHFWTQWSKPTTTGNRKLVQYRTCDGCGKLEVREVTYR